MSGVLALVTKFGLSKDSKARGEGFIESGRGRASNLTQLSKDQRLRGVSELKGRKVLGVMHCVPKCYRAKCPNVATLNAQGMACC